MHKVDLMKSILVLIIFIALQCSALYPATSDVIELTESDFEAKVINSSSVWIVEFFAPGCGHCQKLVPKYEKVATALKGIVNVGAIDVDTYKSLKERYDIKGFPTIKIFGTDKSIPQHFRGPHSTDKIAEAALTSIREDVRKKLGVLSSDDVVTLTDDNFENSVLQSDDIWLVEFYAPWCGFCLSLAPEWKRAASELKGKVKLGAIDATVHKTTAALYEVHGYPTIKYFHAGQKKAQSAEHYDGGRTADEIVSWALKKVAENTTVKPIQILNKLEFQNVCEQKPLCVIAFLPHILDCQSECRNNYLSILEEVGKKYKNNLWGWAWSEAGAQLILEHALEVGGFGYPTLAVINSKKMKYSSFRGAFSKTGIDDFLRDLSYGRGYTVSVKDNTLPDITLVEPWNGKDAVLPFHEIYSEQFDAILSDKEEL